MRTYIKKLNAYWEIKQLIKLNGIKLKKEKIKFYRIATEKRYFELSEAGYLTVLNFKNNSSYSIFKSKFNIYIERRNILTNKLKTRKVTLDTLRTISKHLKNNLNIK